jgi:hypothetical protein
MTRLLPLISALYCLTANAEPGAQYCIDVHKGLPLVAAEPMNGRPESMAFLKPYESSYKDGRSTDRWTELSGTSPEGKWMVCYYGANKQVATASRMDDDISECVITSWRKEPKQPKVEIRCK